MKKGVSSKTFDPEKYGMKVCPDCNGNGFIQNPKHQCCPKCGGFGLIKKGRESLEEDKK